MWKKILVLLLVATLALGVTAQAVEVLAVRTEPSIFSGTTATCRVNVRGDNASDSISLTAKLWQGNTCLKTWSTSGAGQVTLSRTATVQHGQTYKLTADTTINGVRQATKSIIKTCP